MSIAVKPDIKLATEIVATASEAIEKAVASLKKLGGPDTSQVLAYEIAHVASAVATAKSMLSYGVKGDVESRLACAFVADMIHDLVGKLIGREKLWEIDPSVFAHAHDFVTAYRDPDFLATLASEPGPRHLDPEFEMVQDTFRSYANNEVAPRAEHVHRFNEDVPEEVIAGLAEMGAFGLSIPVEYGGYSEGGDGEYMGNVIATEELSRGSLGIGGSLITRPEILARALMKGGTEAQKQHWLAQLATAETLAAVAVTEPDYGSDVANIKVTATPSKSASGEDGYLINGVKTWCTFGARANVLMLLARTDSDRTIGHRGLSLFIVPKPIGEAHGFVFNQDSGGKMEGRPIDTIGYRGMHSYEIAFDGWWVSAENLIGGPDGIGKGFYFQMAGFENGRLQTAARAVGVMQAAYEAALDYSQNRSVFGHNVFDYQLTKAKLGRMAVIIQACRQFSYEVAKLMAKGEGTLEASMVKAYACKAAEWVTREAMQIHGGYGYAEEYPVSRLFVDARVLSIFEGADETLCLKVISRQLVS